MNLIDPETAMWEGIIKQYTDKNAVLKSEIETLTKVNKKLQTDLIEMHCNLNEEIKFTDKFKKSIKEYDNFVAKQKIKRDEKINTNGNQI